MRIIVTGDSGLLGKNLKRNLFEQGHKVLGMSRRSGYDLRDKEKTKQIIEKFKPDYVYHLAANSAESRGQLAPQDMTERNLNIFLNVLVPSINIKIKRFIYTSSVSVYGDAELPYAEDSIPKPKDIYGVNKLAAEQMLILLSKVHGLDYTIFRPHNIYGPFQDMSNPYKNVVGLLMRNILEDKECILYGGGKMTRAFSYVDDVVEVLLQAREDKFKNQVLNVGSCLEIDILTLLSLVEKISGKKAKRKYLPARPQEVWRFICDHRRQNLLFSYHETPIEEGLRKTWEHITLPQVKVEPNEIKK